MVCVSYPEDMLNDKKELIEERLLSCGRSIMGVSVKVVDEEGKDVGRNKEGELVVKNNFLKIYFSHLFIIRSKV